MRRLATTLHNGRGPHFLKMLQNAAEMPRRTWKSTFENQNAFCSFSEARLLVGCPQSAAGMYLIDGSRSFFKLSTFCAEYFSISERLA